MKTHFLILFLFIAGPALSQDIHYAHEMVKELSSKELWGRGYTNNGMAKAADLICSAFKAYGLSPMNGTDFKQAFSFPVNTFPGKMQVTINGKKLSPGKDFIVMPQSIGKIAKGKFEQKDSITFADSSERVIAILKDKLTWSVAPEQGDFTEHRNKKTPSKAFLLTFKSTLKTRLSPNLIRPISVE
ncbi:hypothetical protein [Pedobacter panaciterrae]